MRRWLSVILILIAVVFGAVLGALNAAPVAIDLLFIQGNIALGLALAIVLALGLFIGSLSLWLFKVLPLHARLRRMQRELKLSRQTTDNKTAAESRSTALAEK